MFRYLMLFALLSAMGCDSTQPTVSNTPLPVSIDSFEILFGTDNFDEGRALIQLADGDLLLAGAGDGVVAPADGTLPTPSLSRISPNGEVRWNRIYSNQQYGAAVAIVETTPGHLFLLTDLHNAYFDDHRLALWHLASMQFGPHFERRGAQIAYEASRPLITTDDGGFLLLGTERTTTGPDPAFILRLDASGTQRWEHRLQGTPTSLYAALALPDGGFIVLGQERTSDVDRNILLLRFDRGGTLLWQERLDSASLTINTIAPANDGRFLLAGTNHDVTSPNVYVLQVDARGHPLQDKTHFLPSTDSWTDTRSLVPTTDGGFIATGSFSLAGQMSAAFVLKLSETGTLEWLRDLSKADTYTRSFDVTVLADGNFAIAGTRGPNTPSYGGANFDNLVAVLTPEGTLMK